MEIFGSIGTWFGYVGACVAAPDATCRPLLAFVALGVAALAALTLVLLAYRDTYARVRAESEERHAAQRSAEVQERLQHSLAERAAIKPMLQGRLRAAA